MNNGHHEFAVEPADSKELANLIQLLRQGVRFSVLVGAGISASARVPTAPKIVRILKARKLAKSEDYATAMMEAFTTAAERRAFLERRFLGRPATDEHFVLAELVGRDVFGDVLTTNFDHLTEIALSQVCSRRVHVLPFKEIFALIDEESRAVRVAKLHGDFLFDTLANTDREMAGALTAEMGSRLKAMLKGRGLVVAGYRGDDSIFKLLLKMSREKGVLTHGIWWFFYWKENLEPNEEAQKRGERERIWQFLREFEDSGKCGVLIRDIHGIGHVLRHILKSVPGSDPSGKPPFGLGSSSQLGPIVRSYSLGTPGEYRHPLLDPHYERLQAAMSKPGIVVIEGSSGSGKTRIVNKWLEGHPEKLTYYFGGEFQRNLPIWERFFRDLGYHLHQKRVVDEASGDEFWPSLIFRHGGALVLDQFPLNIQLPGRGFPLSLELNNQFVLLLMFCAAAFKDARNGNLIVTVPWEARHSWEKTENVLKILADKAITKISLEGGASAPSAGNLYKKSLRLQRQLLDVMMWLRYAERAEVIAAAAGLTNNLDDVRKFLDSLVSGGFASRSQSRYMLRSSSRLQLLHKALRRYRSSKLREMLIRAAESFESAANDPETLDPMHYLLEAENKYWGAEVRFGASTSARGMKMLAMVGAGLDLKYFFDSTFYLSTLRDYHDRLKQRMFTGLDITDVSTLFSIFQQFLKAKQSFSQASGKTGNRTNLLLRRYTKSFAAGEESEPWLEFYEILLQEVDSQSHFLWCLLRALAVLDEERDWGIPWLQAQSHLLDVANELKQKKDTGSLSRLDWQVLGRCYLHCGKFCTDLYLLMKHNKRNGKEGQFVKRVTSTYLSLLNPTEKKNATKNLHSVGVELVKQAGEWFRVVHDSVGIADSRRNLGVAHMNARKYSDARRVLFPLLYEETSKPGYGRFKAAELHNLAYACLGARRTRLAEGFFHEAIYLYSQTGSVDQIVRQLLELWQFVLDTFGSGRKQRGTKMPQDEPVPSPWVIGKKAITIWSILSPNSSLADFERLTLKIMELLMSTEQLAQGGAPQPESARSMAQEVIGRCRALLERGLLKEDVVQRLERRMAERR